MDVGKGIAFMAGRFMAKYGLIPVIVPWDDVEVAMQTGELDGVCLTL